MEIVRGVRINQDTYDAIEHISRFGKKEQPVRNPRWFSIEETSGNRVMKYNHLSPVHKTWKENIHTRSFLDELEHEVLEMACGIVPNRPTYILEAKYVVGRYNLLKNRGYIGVDQQAHTDYRGRVGT